jgi:hypothetical protein
MPIVQWWKETAKQAGLNQEQFDQGVNMFVQNAIAALPDPTEEMQKLGDSAKERVEAAELWSKKKSFTRNLQSYFKYSIYSRRS